MIISRAPLPDYSDHIKRVEGTISYWCSIFDRSREMAATSQATLNQPQPLFEDQEMPPQMGFFSFPSQYLTYPQLASCHQSLRGFIIPPSLAVDAPCTTNLTETLLLSSATNKQREEDTIASDLEGPHLLSLQRSSANLW